MICCASGCGSASAADILSSLLALLMSSFVGNHFQSSLHLRPVTSSFGTVRPIIRGMSTTTQAEELDITENPPQESQPSTEAPPNPPSNHHTPESPQGGTPTPDGRASHLEDIELDDLSEADRETIGHLNAALRRTWWLAQRERLKKLLAPSLKQTFALFGLLATLLGVGLLIFQQIHIQEPMKKATQGSTAAAVASAAAAEWANFMAWVTEVCPDELVSFSILKSHIAWC
jgi:hypothetical protein